MENKLFKMLAIIIGVILLLVIIIVIVMALMGGRVATYQQLEDKLIVAAKSYYKNNSSMLPTTLGSTTEVSDVTLVEGKYIKSMDKLSPKGSVCSGKVVVKNVNNSYFYQAFVNCGDSYNTTVISDYVKSHTSVVTSGTGLYANNGNYVYRGEKPENYIKFANKLYRIVKINSDSTIDIINTESKNRVLWDNRYNLESRYEDGINNYSLSRIRDSLLKYINSKVFSDQERSMLEPHSICIGKSTSNTDYVYGSECSETLDNQIIGLLPLSSYVYASLDSNCVKTTSGSCRNYNYLVTDFDWWTLTADTTTTRRVFAIGRGGSASLSKASTIHIRREVLRLTDKTVYVSGSGTETDPYIVK